MKTLTQLFNLGMMRDYPEIVQDHTSGIVLNLGPGNKHIEGATELEYPSWDAETMPIPFANNSVRQIHAYHFFEHIKNVPFLTRECERVLIPGGHINIVVPYYNSQMQAQDLDHKSAFCETTFKVLFDSDYYKKGKCKPMKIATNFIMGDSERTLCK
jgi:ubiquinone/menaquinone biosynthesis C-methylase UbiE